LNYYQKIRSVLFKLDAEDAHHLALKAGKLGGGLGRPVVKSLYQFQSPFLEQEAFGLIFKNPPEDRALINRMGLNNDGADEIASKLKSRKRNGFHLGVNITKTHDPNILGEKGLDDILYSYQKLVSVADFVTLNVSCPNTAEGKTLEDPQALKSLLGRIYKERENRGGYSPPLLVKLSPFQLKTDEAKSELSELLGVINSHGVDAIVLTNTSNSREGLKSSESVLNDIGKGGLSGEPLDRTALEMTRFVYQETSGEIPLIGVGGVHDGPSAWARICAGASLLQIYTALVYEGPSLVKRINKYLFQKLVEHDFKSIAEAVGIHVDLQEA